MDYQYLNEFLDFGVGKVIKDYKYNNYGICGIFY
jgi:hypothetical protein